MSVKHAIGKGLKLASSLLKLGFLKPGVRVATKARVEHLRPGHGVHIGAAPRALGRYRYYRVSLRGLAAQLRHQFLRRMPGGAGPGTRATFLAFGVGLGLIEEQYKEEMQAGVTCREIQGVFSRKNKRCEDPLRYFRSCGYKLEEYLIGQRIGKGSNAAVYEAIIPPSASNILTALKPSPTATIEEGVQCSISRSCAGVPGKNWNSCLSVKPQEKPVYPLAVKMLWNIAAGSSSEAILRSMGQELVPASPKALTEEYRTINICGTFGCPTKKLEPHSNVIQILRAFTSDMPLLPDASVEYPDVLPARLNPTGIGHNRTLFLVMKNYPGTLRQYLSITVPEAREGAMMILQLLEGVDHLVKHGIAHRDLKSDNILVEFDAAGFPRLVITDFGCCLADKSVGLKLPFTNWYVDRGGNSCLMAPEVATALPAPGVVIDYSKSDAWAVGAISYEILGQPNPFYTPGRQGLESRNYLEKHLPTVPNAIPVDVRHVVKLLLRRNPNRRPSARVAANMMHLSLWGEKILNLEKPSLGEAVSWLLSQAAIALLLNRLHGSSVVEVELRKNFLANLDYEELRTATTLVIGGRNCLN